MATVVTGLACSLSLQSAAYLQGLNAAAMATTNAAKKMQGAFNQATTATNQATQAIQRQAAVARTAATQTNQSFLQMGRSVTAVANGLRGLFAIGLIMEGVRAVTSYADTWKEATNKIGAAAQISGKQAASMDELVAVSVRTRTSIEDISDTYSKLLRTTADLDIAQGKQVQMTETVAEAFKAGGASMLEQVNAIRQLGQALGSGLLQGDELRSIRENAPLIAKAIAEEFGVTIAGLKKLGAEGMLTSDRVAKAIIDHQDEIHAAFAATTATFGDSITVLNTGFGQLIGKLNEASNASQRLYEISSDAAEKMKSPDLIQGLKDEFKSNLLFISLERLSSGLMTIRDAALEAAGNLGLLPEKMSAITQNAITGANELMTYAGALKDVNNYGGSAGVQGDMFTQNMADKPHGLGTYGPEQGLDFEGIAKNAVKAEEAVNKLKATQHDWATQTEVTDQGKLQIDAYSHLAEYIKKTETPFETYKRTLAEVAILERDGALTTEQAFRERAMSSLTFANTALGAAGAMSGALTQLFKNNKAVAIANAVINTAEAITSALKNPPGPPFSYVYAAAAAVAGAAQIATIMSTNPGGGGKTPSVKSGGGKAAKASSAAPAAAGDASTTSGKLQTSVNITLEGEGGFSGEQVRSLIAEINKAVGDGAMLKVSG